MPIGNLTSQIFANVYFNEFDRFVKHFLKPQAYLRYGDDFIMVEPDKNRLIFNKNKAIKFLAEKLKLEINHKNDIILKTSHGLYFLGVEIFPAGRRLKKRNWNRANGRLNWRNIASYKGLIGQHGNLKKKKYFNWIILKYLDEI